MKKQNFGLVFAMVVLCAVAPRILAAEKPNIILVMTDEPYLPLHFGSNHFEP